MAISGNLLHNYICVKVQR